VHPKSTANIDTLVGGLIQNNGCRVPCTFFVMTNGSDPKTITQRWQMGDEIGAHAKNHVNQLDPEVGQHGRISEIVGSRDWILEKTSIPHEHVVGYRTPLLAESVEQRQLLKDSGFLYDSSIVESVKTEDLKKSRVWPYSMDAGVPQNRHRIKKGEEGKERHPGLWEVPVWVLLHQGNRYCMGKL
jgi:peptidoglycan/xylan/chitin deacetylase (PgdA/CDA1 family)